MTILRLQLWLLLGLLVEATASPAEQVLHDLARPEIERMTDSGFLHLVNPPFGHQVVLTANSSGEDLDTSAAFSDSAGYFSHSPFNGVAVLPSAPVLDRQTGFSLSFKVQLHSEQHQPSDRNSDGLDDRAGFSVLLVTSDLQAIELGFWEDRIWAQEGGSASEGLLFTQAEGVAQSPTEMARMRPYQLTVFGSHYVLLAEGASVLSGPLRDYTAWPGLTVPIAGTLNPYEQPNLMFLGDDTSSARAHFKIGSPLTLTCGARRSFEVTNATGDSTQLALRWGSLPGLTYPIEQSVNLQEWRFLTSLTSSTNRGEVLVPFPASPRCFYRIAAELRD